MAKLCSKEEKNCKPAPSSQSNLQDAISNKVLAPQMQLHLDLIRFLVKWILRSTVALEQGRFHLSTSFLAKCFMKKDTSFLNNYSYEIMKGVKCQHCSRQASKYFFLLLFSTILMTDVDFLFKHDGWFASQTLISIIQSACRF